MKRSFPALAIALLAGCADPSDTTPANDSLGSAGVAMDIDTVGAENMESPANLSLPVTSAADDPRTIVSGYFDALTARRYDQAYALWEPGAAGMDARAFAASFAKYRSYEAEIGLPGRVDAGAGQRYVVVPVRVTAVLADGGETVTMTGPVTLHRVADIDGATAAQRHWRIRDTAIRPRPAEAAAAPRRAAYACIDGSAFTADFDNAANTATVAVEGEAPVVLAGQRPASGIWYAGEGWELRGKGAEATLARPDQPELECSAAGEPPSGGAGDGAQGDEAR